jgi:hypothetical protein
MGLLKAFHFLEIARMGTNEMPNRHLDKVEFNTTFARLTGLKLYAKQLVLKI